MPVQLSRMQAERKASLVFPRHRVRNEAREEAEAMQERPEHLGAWPEHPRASLVGFRADLKAQGIPVTGGLRSTRQRGR